MELLESQVVLSHGDHVKTEVETGKSVKLANALLLTDFSASSELALPCAVALAHQYQ
jgi:hypothetical protein